MERENITSIQAMSVKLVSKLDILEVGCAILYDYSFVLISSMVTLFEANPYISFMTNSFSITDLWYFV